MDEISNRMVIYIPELKHVFNNPMDPLQQELKLGGSDGILGVKECETLYITSAHVGNAYFDVITINYSCNTITFTQKNQCRTVLGDAVLHALQKMKIQEFTPHELTYVITRKKKDELK